MARAPLFARRRSNALVDQASRLYESRELDAAWRTLESAVQEDPDNGEAEFLLGRVAYERGRPLIAIAHLERCVALSPKSPTAHAELARLYHETRRRQEAEREYARALALKADPYTAINFATLLRDSGRFDDATRLYQQALASSKLDADTRQRIRQML